MEELLVVGLGPDRPGLMTLETADAMRSADLLILRTGKHGAVQWIEKNDIAYECFDELYERAEDFDAFSASVVEAVRNRMQAGIAVCYAVAEPQTDRTVLALLQAGIRLRILAGVTYASAVQAKAMERLGLGGGARFIPAADIEGTRIEPDLPLIITEINSRLLAGDIKIAMLAVYPPAMEILFCGEPIALSALDRQKHYDHLSTAYLPPCPYAGRERYVLSDLEKIMSRLRDPGSGCPWDIKQTHESLRTYLLEEAYEVIDAIDAEDPLRIADELGDVLLQVIFHAKIAEERREFSLLDIISSICSKLIHRHTHIFGDAHCDSAEDVLKNWEAIKQAEKGLKSKADSMRDIPKYTPSLMRAMKVQEKAKRMGYDASEAPVLLDRIRQNITRIAEGDSTEQAVGEILLDLAAVAKVLDVDAELALQKSVDRFIDQF